MHRTGAALLLVAVAVAGCGGDDGVGLPDCAAGLPVPDSLEVVDTSTGETEEGAGTCVLTLAGDEPLDATVAAWERALEGDGWDHAVQPGGERSTFVQLRAPACGLVMVFAPGSERVSAKVPRDRTPTLVSMLPCDVLPDEQEPAGS